MNIIIRYKDLNGEKEDLEFQSPDSKKIIRPILTIIPRIGERVKIVDTYYEVYDVLHMITHANMDLNSIIVWVKEIP